MWVYERRLTAYYLDYQDIFVRFQVLTAASIQMTCLLGCCAMQSGKNRPTFHRSLMPSPSDHRGNYLRLKRRLISTRLHGTTSEKTATLIHSDRLCASSSLISNDYLVLCPLRLSSWGVNLDSHLHLVSRLGMSGAIHPLLHTCSWRSV
jgi:hypothetical protein